MCSVVSPLWSVVVMVRYCVPTELRLKVVRRRGPANSRCYPSSWPVAESATVGPSNNPWSSVKRNRSVTSAPFENPWNSVQTPTQQTALIQELFTAKELPPDPTVEHPSATRGSSYRSSSPIRLFDEAIKELPGLPTTTSVSTASVLTPPPASPATNTDPLGVGSV